MKRTIGKAQYDTASACVLHKETHGRFGDPAGYEETVCRTEDGRYFLYCNGGKSSKHPEEKIKALSKAAAEKLLAERGAAT
ncbi:MAG: hypothetical protein IJR89_06880 [Clostridia bacterium]|nr:hypothetical protein [Clostridia bacterium]